MMSVTNSELSASPKMLQLKPVRQEVARETCSGHLPPTLCAPPHLSRESIFELALDQVKHQKDLGVSGFQVVL